MTTTTAPSTTTSSRPEGWRLAPPGRSTGPLGHISQVARLTDQMTALDVRLPAEITRLSATWATLDDLRQPKPEPAVGLLADADTITGMVLAAAQRRATLAEVGVVIDQMERELLSDATSWYQHHADDVIDQLRPSFDAAARAVRGAVSAGVTSTMGLRDAPDDAVTLWRAAYGRGAATDQLSAVASARYALSESCWIAPMETGVSNRGDFSVAVGAPAGWWDHIGRSWETVANPQLCRLATPWHFAGSGGRVCTPTPTLRPTISSGPTPIWPPPGRPPQQT